MYVNILKSTIISINSLSMLLMNCLLKWNFKFKSEIIIVSNYYINITKKQTNMSTRNKSAITSTAMTSNNSRPTTN